jgi:hypothetical protein
MANGTYVPSSGRWFGDVSLGGQTVKSWFEIFLSGGGWSLLVGKPLLERFKARDVIMIPSNGEWTTLVNKAYTGDNNISLRGNDDPPSRQVPSSVLLNTVPFDKHLPSEPLLKTAQLLHQLSENTTRRRQGRRARNKQKRSKADTQPSRLRSGGIPYGQFKMQHWMLK